MPLVPRFLGAWTCPDWIVLALDRWKGDMAARGLEQAQAVKLPADVLLFTATQLDDMFRIAQRLDELGVVHGDLKPQQLLYDDDGHMAVTDFGLATTYGWSTSHLGGCLDYIDVHAQVPEAVRPYFNQAQLAASLIQGFEDVLVQVGDKLARFGGLARVPAEWKRALGDQCPKLTFTREGDVFVNAVEGIARPATRSERSAMTLQKLSMLADDLEGGDITEAEFNASLAHFLQGTAPL
jgi:serine/threonine protein kinase